MSAARRNPAAAPDAGAVLQNRAAGAGGQKETHGDLGDKARDGAAPRFSK